MSPAELEAQIIARLNLTPDELSSFLNPDFNKHSHDPFLFQDMQKAVERIFKAIKDQEKIAIYADFDADGIPGAVLLQDFLKQIGADTLVYIPHRDKEGYGFHKKAIDTLKKEGASLLITVDVGSGNDETIDYAQGNGIDVIVTDHHEVLKDINHAYAVLNPKKPGCTYPFKELCGAGVAFKLVQGMSAYGRKHYSELFDNYKQGMEKWLLDLVAIATLSDMVPLVGENRVFAKWGLVVLRKTYRPGLKEFFSQKRMNITNLDEDDITFNLTPRINAASRMGDPFIAFKLLSSNSRDQARIALKQLEQLNNARKTKVASMVRQLKKRILALPESLDVIVVGDQEYSPSLCGLAAGKLADEFQKTVCVWGKEASGVLKGSCRSPGDVHIPSLFENSKDVLLDFGGHAFAGGFAVKPEELHILSEKINQAYPQSLNKLNSNSEDTAHFSLKLSDTAQIKPVLDRFAPFGIGNPKPEFLFENVPIKQKASFGSGAHLQLWLQQDGVSARAFQFFSPVKPESLKDDKISFLAHLQKGYKNPNDIELKITSIL